MAFRKYFIALHRYVKITSILSIPTFRKNSGNKKSPSIAAK